MREMDQRYTMNAVIALFFNASYVNLVLYKYTKYWIKDNNIYIDYKGLSYLEYTNMVQKVSNHKLFIGKYRYKGEIDYHTVFILRINPTQRRLISLVENRYYHLLSDEVKKQIFIFTSVYSIDSNKTDRTMIVFEDVNLENKNEVFTLNCIEEQDINIQISPCLEDMSYFE